MRAAAEAEMPRPALGGQDELVRVLEPLRVTVGGAEDDDHRLAAADRLPPKLDVHRRPPIQRPLDRPVVTDQLLDGPREERRIALDRRALLGMREKGKRGMPIRLTVVS